MDISTLNIKLVIDYIVRNANQMHKTGLEQILHFEGQKIEEATRLDKLDKNILENINDVVLFILLCYFEADDLTQGIKDQIMSAFRNLRMDLEEKFGYHITFKISFVKRKEKDEEDYDDEAEDHGVRFKIKYFFNLNDPFEDESNFEFGYETDEEIKERLRKEKEDEENDKKMDDYIQRRQRLVIDDFIEPPKKKDDTESGFRFFEI